MKAVILAAGEGQRLRPLTVTRPKPMLPAANRPLLEHTLLAVAEAGIDDVILVVGYRQERIQSYFGDGDDWDVDITYVVQADQLGSGHALLQAEPELDDDFVALNGDEVHEAELIEGVVELREATGDLVMGVTAVDTPEEYGVLEVEDDRVVSITERPPVELVESNLINAGVYGFDLDVFDALRATEFELELGITNTLNRRLEDRPVRPYRHDQPRLDVTTPWDLLDVNGVLVDRDGTDDGLFASVHPDATLADQTVLGTDVTIGANASVLRGSAIGENATIGPNAVLSETVVLPDATVRAGAVLDRCIVGQNARIGPGAAFGDGPARIVLEDDIYGDVHLGGVIGDNVEIGANVTGLPGVIVGHDARVAGGAVIEDRIADGSQVTRG